MVGIGFVMLGIGAWSLLARARKKLYDWTWLHRAAVVMGPSCPESRAVTTNESTALDIGGPGEQTVSSAHKVER